MLHPFPQPFRFGGDVLTFCRDHERTETLAFGTELEHALAQRLRFDLLGIGE